MNAKSQRKSQTSKQLSTFNKLATFTAMLTLALITLGGYVHNSGSSLACPDWPLCFGQVMPKMEGGVLIEHSHRMLATLVGFAAILLVFFSHKIKSEHKCLNKMSIITLLAVIVQGILGGITVIYKLPPLISTLHLGLSQIFFAMTLYLSWASRSKRYSPRKPVPTKTKKLLTGVTVLLFFQVIIGAVIRHTGAGAACGLGPEYALFCIDDLSDGTTFWPLDAASRFHVFHRYFGILMIFIIVGGTLPVIKWAKEQQLKTVRLLSVMCHITVLAQVLLGILSIITILEPHTVTLHLTFASVLFALLVSLNILIREDNIA